MNRLSLSTILVLLMLWSLPLSAQKFAVVNGTWDGAIWALSAGGPAGETGTPTSADSIVLKSGVTLTVETATAACRGISFQDTSAHFFFSPNAVLSVYGDIGLASVSHRAFSGWGSGAKIRFAGDLVQTLRGWSTSGFSTSFNYMLVDKSGGKVTTDGTNMRLGVGDTLEVLNGTFELGNTDDIESRSYSGAASSFVLLVRVNGIFTMVGSTSHIRRASNTTVDAKRIGKATIFGSATFRSTSTNALNFAGIDVEAGGLVSAASFSNSAAGNFNTGTVKVKNGGELRVVSSAPFWDTTTAAVELQEGGIYRINVADPANAFPRPLFVNNGTVRYGLTGDQKVKDMPYHRLEISFAGIKTWTLDTFRVVSDSLEVNNSAVLRITSSSGKNVTVNGTLRLTSGSVNNADSNGAALVMGNGSVISRATGTIAAAPQFAGGVRVRYTSSVQTTVPGPELPADPTVLKKLTVTGSRGVQLTSDLQIRDTLELINGKIFLDSTKLIFGPAAVLAGTLSDSTMIATKGTAVVRKQFTTASSFTFAVGDTMNGSRYTPATLAFSSGTFSNATVDVALVPSKHPSNTSANHYISRYWKVNQSGITNFTCDATFGYHPTDVTGSESKLVLGRWTGSTWASALDAADSVQHKLHGTVTSFSEFTGGERSGVTEVVPASTVPSVFALSQNYPNPFNPSTTIAYDLPTTSTVTLAVYDVIGRNVATLAHDQQNAGHYTLRVDAGALGLSSGVYFYRIDARHGASVFTQVRKMLLTK